MSTFNYSEWGVATGRLARLVEAGFEDRFGYPPDENVVAGPSDPDLINEALSSGSVPDALLEFYRAVGEVSLPDVHSGYFISPLSWVLSGLDGDQPVRMAGAWNLPIVVFGSDGSGSMFAIAGDGTERVLILPSGPVRDQVYEDTMTPARVVADDLPDFLAKLQRSVAAFLHGGESELDA